MKKISSIILATTAATLFLSGNMETKQTKKKSQTPTETVKCQLNDKSTCGGASGCGGKTGKKILKTSRPDCDTKGGTVIK